MGSLTPPTPSPSNLLFIKFVAEVVGNRAKKLLRYQAMYVNAFAVLKNRNFHYELAVWNINHVQIRMLAFFTKFETLRSGIAAHPSDVHYPASPSPKPHLRKLAQLPSAILLLFYSSHQSVLCMLTSRRYCPLGWRHGSYRHRCQSCWHQ